MPQVIVLVDDLFFQSRITQTAALTNTEVRTITTVEQLRAEVSREVPSLVIVDLNARTAVLDGIREVRAAHPQVRIVGYLSHVQKELEVQARAAGCSEVMPRSRFTQELATLLKGAPS
jgi:DNA-binding NarL/FixJ family response regulator